MPDNSIKAKISALNDMQLYNLISSVALASGMDAKKVNSLVGDIPRLRRMLQSLDDNQINTLLSSLGNGSVRDIIGRL